MLQVLHSPSLSQINDENKAILEISKSLKSLEIANGIFTLFSPLPEFIPIAAEYKASIEKLISVKQVNDWCKEKTHGKIPEIMKQLSKSIRMILLNAVYFKGKWEKPFKKENTTNEYFKNFGKQTKSVRMMKSTQDFLYYENNEIQCVEMNYKNSSISSLVILPKRNGDINNYIGTLNPKKVEDILKGLSTTKVEIHLPKFEFSYEIKLKNTLIEMGMTKAFSPGADFSGIKKEGGIFIDEVIHKTFIQTDEEGTKAAAVTAVSMVRGVHGLEPPPKKIIMKVDHPFIFIIRNKKFPANHGFVFISKIESL